MRDKMVNVTQVTEDTCGENKAKPNFVR